jgi:glycosyltransferase involved in cell wall biosynthesis
LPDAREAVLIGLGQVEGRNAENSEYGPRRWSEWAIPEAFRQLGYCPQVFTAAQWAEYRKPEVRKDRWRLYGEFAFAMRSIRESDWVITLGAYGCALSIIASLMRRVRCRAAKVGVFAFFTGSRPCSKLLEITYKLGIRRSSINLFMIKAQLDESVSSDGCPASSAALIRIGVDTTFFAPRPNRVENRTGGDSCLDTLRELAPYVAVVGDQLRDEELVARVMLGSKGNLVRVTRNRFVEEFWKSYSDRESVGNKVFCRAGMSSEFLRAVYWNAIAVLNLADASWQPAGWSVATEAMACCTPVILQRGLVSDELSRIFARPAEDFIYPVESGDAATARLHLERIISKPDEAEQKARLAQQMTETHLPIERTVKDIVSEIARLCS